MIACLLVCLAPYAGSGQTWDAELTIDPYPSPFLSDWQTDPTMATLEITNPTAKPDVIIVDLDMSSNSGAHFRGSSQRMLVNPDQTLAMNSTEFNAWYTQELDKGVKDKATRTGMMPEGSYQACVTVKNLWGTVLAQNVCAYFSISHAEPPELIYPISGQLVDNPYPVFQWIPPQLPVGKQMVVVFRLVKVLPNQTPEMALSANYPHYENFNLFESNMEYPLDGPALESNATYVWQVQALDFEGKPVTKNDGRSIIGMFTTSSTLEGMAAELQLLAPENQTVVAAWPIDFQWNEPDNMTGSPLHYEIRIAEITTGSSPEQALSRNILHFSTKLFGRTEWIYPSDAPAFISGKCYAWQVQATDESGNPASANDGFSAVWSFTIGRSLEQRRGILPERLPLLGETIAFVELIQNGKPAVNYHLSADSSSLVIKGPMTMVLPALQTGSAAPRLLVSGELCFNPATLQIISGQLYGDVPQQTACFNLSPAGVPLALTQMAYRAELPDRIECRAVPVLFGRVLANSPLDARLQSDGCVHSDVSTLLTESIPLVANSNKLLLEIKNLVGTIHASLPSGVINNHLSMEADLLVSSGSQFARFPVSLQLAKDGAASREIVSTQQAMEIDLGTVTLGLSNMTCRWLRYQQTSLSWSFDLAFDLALDFSEIGVTLPTVRDVHLSRLGIEIPQISVTDLGVQENRSYKDLWIRPRAFRMYSYTFDWHRWNGGEIGDWGFFWDVDIQMPYLPQHATSLDQTPFRANNAIYTNGAFKGSWNMRTFAPAVFVPLSDSVNWGLAIHEIKGSFLPDGGLTIGVKADWIPPGEVNQNSQPDVFFNTEQLSLSPRGIFSGRTAAPALSHPIHWGPTLSITPGSVELLLGAAEDRQTASLRISGSIALPTRADGTVDAAGEGIFDLFTWRLVSGQFTIQNGFTVDLPWPDRLIGLQCQAGALVDQRGLHVTIGARDALLANGDNISCQAAGELLIALPEWTVATGTIQFNESFALDLSEWHSGKSRMKWQTRRVSDQGQSGSDHLFMILPNRPRMDADALVTAGNSKATCQFKGQRHELEAAFSHDFLFSVNHTSVQRGKVQFSVANQNVAVLDSDGLHLGEYFGVHLLSTKIGLPDTSIAYLSMTANPKLSIVDENGLKRIKSDIGQNAVIHFPALKYQAETVPTILAQVDLLVDPATFVIINGSVQGQGLPLASLVKGHVPLDIIEADYSSGKWRASVQPILPMALRPNHLVAACVSIGANGLNSYDAGYSHFAGAPQDSVVLGEYLTVTLDGTRCIAGALVPQISFSGDFKPSAFGGQSLHFTSSLSTDSALFVIKTPILEPTLGCGVLALAQESDEHKVEAPINKRELLLAVAGVLKLDSLSTECALTLPRLEIRGNGMALKQPMAGTAPQSLRLFGSEVTVTTTALHFSKPDRFDLVLNGSLKLFNKFVNLGLHLLNGCTVADGVIADYPKGLPVNSQLALLKLETKSGHLAVGMGLPQPQPFDGTRMDTLSLAINSQGQWLDDNLNPLDERQRTVAIKNKTAAVVLGNKKFSINAYLTGITLGLDGQDNTGDEGFVKYRVDTFWPSKNPLGGLDSVCIGTDGLYRFHASNVTSAWAISQDTNVDTVMTTLDNDLYMHAADFSMADTAGYQIHFNCIMQLPLPADVINGQVELLNNRLGPGLWETGKLHTAQIYIAGFTLELLDFHYAKNEMIDSKEIEFTQTVASVQDTKIWADLYLSFGAKMATGLPGIEGGIERFVIFKNADQFHLAIKHWTGWVGDYLFFDAELVGSIWQGDKTTGEKTRFKWLVGGNLDIELGDFKGGSLVGEVSFRETVNVNNQVETLPGFGLYGSLKFELDMTPIPVTLTGVGIGMFFNPSKEIRDMVYYHTLGYYEHENKEILDEFKAVMDATQDDMMTVGEVYLFGSGSIPKKDFLDASVLYTFATDRISLHSRVAPAEKTDIAEIVDLTGWVEAECAWKQDFSGFKYLAGHWKIGGRAKTEETKAIKIPENAQAQLDFILTREAKFAVAGHLAVETLGNNYLTAECNFTFGNPGFVFSGSIGTGINMYILYVEAGMDMTIYLKWLNPVKFGISADCYVQGAIIDDWLCGFRGEMGAALVVEPELYLYGYAELTGTLLGISKTVRAWAKWEQGGGVSSGTGADPTLEEYIAESQAVADEIMSSLLELRAEIGMLDVLQYGGLTDEEVLKIIQNLSSGMYDQYIKTWDEDFPEFGKAAVAAVDELVKQGYKEKPKQVGLFFDQLIGLRDALTNEGFYPLLKDVRQIEPLMEKLKTAMQNRIENLKKNCTDMVSSMNTIDFALDTLLVLTDIEASPIRNPYSYSYTTIEGVRSPVISLNESIDQRNQKNIKDIQQALDQWLITIESNIQKIRKGRKEIFALIGPNSVISHAQGDMLTPMLSNNSSFTNALKELNKSFSKCYDYYGNIPSPWNSDEVFTLAAKDRQHRQLSNERRLAALTLMQVPTGTLPVNEIDYYRVLGNLFYRTMPQVILQYYLRKADSLMVAFDAYANGTQTKLDKIHQNLTFDMDIIWDKYAELSEKVYAITDNYQTALKALSNTGENLVLKDSTAVLLTQFEKEFSYPTVNPVISVSQTDGFLPVAVTVACQSDQPDQIAEYAVSLDNNLRQSMGKENHLVRDYMLKHGTSYWLETEEGAIASPFANPEQRQINISPRVRNKAGLTASACAVNVAMSGKDWRYGHAANQVVQTMKPDSMYRCLVHWPYPGAQLAAGPVFFCKETNALTVRWSLQKNYGIYGVTPVPAKHQIELLLGDRTVFGPKFFAVTETETPDTFRVRLDGLFLKANTGEPYHVVIREYDLNDVLIATSSGTVNVMAMKEDGSTYTISRTWEPPPLYIDTTPPVITGHAEFVDIGNERFVIYRFPKAKDEVKIAGTVYSKWISDPHAYEYKLLPLGEKPDSFEWQSMPSSDLIALPRSTRYQQDLYTFSDPGSGSYCLNFGARAFADSLQFIVRGCNSQLYWGMGYSSATTFIIPKADETEAPLPATFNILGLNHNKDLEISITEPGTDRLSGVSHYPWRLCQNLYRSANQIVRVWQPNTLRFPADSVQSGAVLTIPIPHDSIDVDNALTVELATVDRCGNQAVSQQEFRPPPPAPDLVVQLLPGFKPFTLLLSGAMAVFSQNYVDSLLVQIGTVPDAADILLVKKSFTDLYKLTNAGTFSWQIDLPATATEGVSLYLSAHCIRNHSASPSYTKRIQIYQPMFASVETDAEGYLVLPILQSAFNGQREANFKWAAGYYAPALQGQNRYQLNIQPLAALPGATGEQIVAGARFRLPIKAAEVRPKTLIVLQAVALDGEIHSSYVDALITPPKPEIKADLTQDRDYDRYFYRLDLQAKFGRVLQSFSSSTDQAHVLLRVGSSTGLADIRNVAIPLVSGSSDGFTFQQMFFDSTISRFERLYLTAFSKTALGVKSIDSAVVIVNVLPPVFWKNPQITFAGSISITAVRSGFRDAGKIVGYQFAVGDGESSAYALRPYPANIMTTDIAAADWSPGKTLTLPFSTQGRLYKTYRVGIRAVLDDGRTNEQIETTRPFLQPLVHVSIMAGLPQLKLVVQGDLGPEMVSQMYQKELRLSLTLNGTGYFFQTLTVADNGVIDKTFVLPTMPPCATYQFISFFWHMQSQQFASYTTDVDMPCSPMFTTVDADSEDMIYVHMVRSAFDGQRNLNGYQFALGSASGLQDIRAFPATGQYDFTAAKVQPGQRLVLPVSLKDLPATAWLALQGIDEQGKFHRTEKSFQARPLRPHVISLRMDANGRFTVEFDRTAFDGKVNSMDCWIKSAQDNEQVIAFQQTSGPELHTGVISLASSFSDTDIGQEFILEGLSIGYQINSLNFQYRFRIENTGGNYRIVPLPL